MRAHAITLRSALGIAHGILLLIAVSLLSACVATTPLKRADLTVPRPEGIRLLIITPDVELSEVTAGGLEEPNAQWTQTGRQHVRTALDSFMASRKVVPVPYREPEEGSAEWQAHVQLLKLHQAVGGTILMHKYNQAALLPTKSDVFDWTLGEGARRLRQETGADYALFVFLHDSYASGGRVAMVVAMAVMGVVMPGGIQRGFASLVDLRSGDVAWFNVLVRGSGDLRSATAAGEAVKALLAEIPL